MVNVLNEIENEHSQMFEYEDEKIISNIYFTSLSYALRSLRNMSDEERIEKVKANDWLLNETVHVKDVKVISFDNLVKKLENGKSSCDAFFYHFNREDGNQHYLSEFKNTRKSKVFQMLNTDREDSIYVKVRDSVQMINTELCFGGDNENQDITHHTHFVLVYDGKNDVATRGAISMPGKKTVSRDQKGKQMKASRLVLEEGKRQDELLARFGNQIEKLGLESCDVNKFPGNALPRASKNKGTSKKERKFSLYSARDFAEIVDNGFFDCWEWGEYATYS